MGLAAPTASTRLVFRRNLLDIGPRQEDATRETSRIVLGVGGKFAEDWSYEVSVNYGRFDEDTDLINNYNRQRLLLALDSTRDGAGNIVCRSKIDPAAAARLSKPRYQRGVRERHACRRHCGLRAAESVRRWQRHPGDARLPDSRHHDERENHAVRAERVDLGKQPAVVRAAGRTDRRRVRPRTSHGRELPGYRRAGAEWHHLLQRHSVFDPPEVRSQRGLHRVSRAGARRECRWRRS